jgi:hypothetical protein
VLALGLAAIAYMSFTAGVWPVGLAGAVLALWMGDLARRDLGLVRRRPGRPPG